ncbi:MAG TPA: UDP-N-acetylglucosamine pyrophosphorylase [Candidatus Acutalibacter pullistercoris]|uniref:UDP-N-acetylglucosamine pyrophosphorylase n=1 Tax=Candidatus Acutalibacter pullistercoris TaxID=2838418 RepID=A0A9D1YDU0_9FIRM|nr:UDP-N-acetylglucosamine pyrophosphorylase [Candidatus Acutalibacter pullistercoris]
MNKDMLRTKELYDLSHTAAAPLLENTQYPWEALSQLGDYIVELGKTLPAGEYEQRGEDVWIHKTAKIYPNNYIAGPCIIGPETEVRPGAFIRGKALVGAHCVVGNSTELKNVILFDNVQVPHYNYVGDSILGYKSHMGAGALTSNVKQDKTPVTVRVGEERLETGLKKFGAMLGDHVEVGCNSVLNPGTVVGRGSHVYPLSMMRGFLPSGMIHKNSGETVPLQERR